MIFAQKKTTQKHLHKSKQKTMFNCNNHPIQQKEYFYTSKNFTKYII